MMQKRWKTGLAVLLGTLLAACSPISVLNLAVSRSGYHVVHDLAYGVDPRQKLDLYVPDAPPPKMPVILFFYGGSWESGSRSLYLAMGQAFASKGIMVAVADYRLFPQVRYPVFLEDGAQAFAYVRTNATQYGGDPARLFLAGHSAGAYNAMMLVADGKYLRQAGADVGQVCGVIGIAGPYNFLPLTDMHLITIFGGANRPETQPITYIDGKRPPMLLAAGTDDTTVSPRNSSDLAEKLKSFGSSVRLVTYPGIGHIGIILSLAPGFRGRTSLRDDVVDFVETTARACK
ncbi:MAG: alpha/beta hydrolase [Pseudomonadota bacterium]